MPRAQIHRQVLRQVNRRRLGRGVSERRLVAQTTDADARDTGRDDHPAGIAQRGLFLQQRREEPDGGEDALDVQVHDLGEGTVRVGVEFLAPGGACVGEQDVDVVGRLGHLGDQPLDLGDFGAVGGYRDGAGRGVLVGEGIESSAGGLASGGFAGGYVDFEAASLKEPGG